jgi:NitT/TauT family transport system permease protein
MTGMSAAEPLRLSPPRQTPAPRLRRLLRTPATLQLLIVAVMLTVWQWVPAIPGAAKISALFDPFFVSSPSRLAVTLYDLATGADQTPMIWVPFFSSVIPAILGTAIAVIAGAGAGLICSNWVLLNRVVRPFLITFNALPRITLIPIFVIIAGPSIAADVAIGFIVVFFLVFFSAYEGGISVPEEMLDNARILGASPGECLRRLRLPYVMVWTFAQLPNAIAFGLTTIVTTELFTGSNGLGRLLLIAVQTANADLTFAVAAVLAVAGLALNSIASAVRRRVLHWW